MSNRKSEEDKQSVLNFLDKNVLATISTVNNKTLQPESALIAFAELQSLEILFVTLKGSRKYINILENSRVAMVVGWDPNPQNWATLQYEGNALPILKEEESKYKEVFLRKKGTPCNKEFLEKPGMQMFRVVPAWIGFSQFPKGKTPCVIEIKF